MPFAVVNSHMYALLRLSRAQAVLEVDSVLPQGPNTPEGIHTETRAMGPHILLSCQPQTRSIKQCCGHVNNRHVQSNNVVVMSTTDTFNQTMLWSCQQQTRSIKQCCDHVNNRHIQSNNAVVMSTTDTFNQTML